MLTSDLVNARVRKGLLCPQFLESSPDLLERIALVIDAWNAHVGRQRDELDEVLHALEADGTDFIVWRGISKLISEGAEFSVASSLNPVDVRRRIFEVAAGQIPRSEAARRELLATVAAEFGVDVEAVDHGFYADLESRQRLQRLKAWTPERLLNRYNVALAQAALFRAASMEIEISDKRPSRLRQVLSALKFFGLMHRIERHEENWKIDIDGPASVVSKSRKYGVNLATFLPVIFHCESWRVRADVEWKPRKLVVFELTSQHILLQPTSPKRGAWISKEEALLLAKFADPVDGWTLSHKASVVKLQKNEVLVADYVLTSPDGRDVIVDIVGFWRQAYLARRIDMLANVREPMVVVVSERMKVEGEQLSDSHVPVVYFKGVIKSDALIAAATDALA